MDNFQFFGKYLLVIGMILVILGGILILSGKVPWLGRLPGDVIIKRENFTLYFPITTCVLLSVILSFILYVFFRKP